MDVKLRCAKLLKNAYAILNLGIGGQWRSVTSNFVPHNAGNLASQLDFQTSRWLAGK